MYMVMFGIVTRLDKVSVNVLGFVRDKKQALKLIKQPTFVWKECSSGFRAFDMDRETNYLMIPVKGWLLRHNGKAVSAGRFQDMKAIADEVMTQNPDGSYSGITWSMERL